MSTSARVPAPQPAVGRGDQPAAAPQPIFSLSAVGVAYGGIPAVRDATLDLARNEITAFIGPSGCGKSTLLRCLNRMNDLIASARVSGRILYHD